MIFWHEPWSSVYPTNFSGIQVRALCRPVINAPLFFWRSFFARSMYVLGRCCAGGQSHSFAAECLKFSFTIFTHPSFFMIPSTWTIFPVPDTSIGSGTQASPQHNTLTSGFHSVDIVLWVVRVSLLCLNNSSISLKRCNSKMQYLIIPKDVHPV